MPTRWGGGTGALTGLPFDVRLSSRGDTVPTCLALGVSQDTVEAGGAGWGAGRPDFRSRGL